MGRLLCLVIGKCRGKLVSYMGGWQSEKGRIYNEDRGLRKVLTKVFIHGTNYLLVVCDVLSQSGG